MFNFLKAKKHTEATQASIIPMDLGELANSVKEFVAANPIIEFKGAKSKTPLVVETSQKARFVRFSLQTEVSFHLDTIEIFNCDGRNIAPKKRTIISSKYNDEAKYNGEGALVGKKNGGCGFHTKREKNPWLIVDLNTIRNLAKIVVYNRDGEFFNRALSLKIEVSKDLHTWTQIFDNWQVLSTFDGKDENEVANAMLHAVILNPEPSKKLIAKLKKSGDTQGANNYLTHVNTILKEQGVALGPHGLTKTFELQSKVEKKKVAKELSQLLQWINVDYGLPAFISSGTLLGIVRDNKFIDHDDDIDICYISKANGEKEILEERDHLFAFLREKRCKVSYSGLAHYWCTTPGGQNLDIFTGFIEGDKCSMNPISRNTISTQDVLPLTTMQHDGATLYLPANPETLLAVNYGENWRKPDPLWTFNWSKAKHDFAFLYTKK